MSDTSAFGFGQFVPGFDFLQNLAKSTSGQTSGGGTVPGMSSWVAPTLSVQELDKRIQELKAVQFWLEQNGTALKATIQALEVQKMTLTTLQGMNVNMAELTKAFTARAPEPEKPSAPTEHQAEPEAKTASTSPRSSKTRAKSKAQGTAVDPMQWWGALTQQFQSIAASAMQDVAAQAMKAQAAPPPAPNPAPKAPRTSARPANAAKKARSSRP